MSRQGAKGAKSQTKEVVFVWLFAPLAPWREIPATNLPYHPGRTPMGLSRLWGFYSLREKNGLERMSGAMDFGTVIDKDLDECAEGLADQDSVSKQVQRP
jgi:hypothetical protein